MLLDVVKVATVVKKIQAHSFIYSPTTTFDYNITDALMSPPPNSIVLYD